MKTLTLRFCGFLWVGLSATSFLRAADSPPPIADLPKNGVCGVIGAGKLEPWMIDLAKTGDVVVHCLVPDENAVQQLGKAADQAGVGGKLTFEAIPATPLPYRENLLNGLVIDRPGDFDREAALRAVAPGGKLVILENGAWKSTSRERPNGMDQWTHVYRDAGGNSGVSTDQFVKFPLGLRWNDDLPFNLRTNQEHSNAWTNTRAIAVVDGRIYYVTNCARENLKRTATEMAASTETQDMWLIARDAWNGTQLWRKKLGPIFYGGLFYTARAPMVAADGKVWAVNKDAQLLEMDGATGEVLRTFQTKHITAHLMLLDGVLVAATWKDGDYVGAPTGIDRRPMDIAITEGTVEAFDLKSGNKLWSQDRLATSLRGSDGRVYLVHRSGTDDYEIAKAMKAKRRGEDVAKPGEPVNAPATRGSQIVLAIDLRSGKTLWERDSAALGAGPTDHLATGVAGLGGVAVSTNTYAITSTEDSSARESIWLNGATGKELVRKKNAGFPVLHEGNVHLGGQAFDPRSGEPSTAPGVAVGVTVCTPQVYVNGITTQNRSNRYRVDGQNKTFGAARGSCMFAAIPANGAFYTAQTYCACAPGTAPGFISFGPIGTEPSADQVREGSQLIKGPAYGRQTGTGSSGWSTFMGSAERNNANPAAEIPSGTMKIEWQSRIAQPMTDTNIEGSWKDSLAGLVTAPVASGGHVFAADLHRRKVMMLGAADGKTIWERYVGGRVTTPPTIDGDLCLFGAADGYVYALDKTEGALAYKLRIAPEDRRMVSHAQLESPWSAFSSVLVSPDGIAYASAGRSTAAESGIVVRAFKAATGEVLWSQTIAYREGKRGDHVNDAMFLDGEHLHLMKSVLNRKTGEEATDPWADYEAKLAAWKIASSTAVNDGQPVPPQPEQPAGLPMRVGGIEGLANPNWTKLGDRRRKASVFEEASGQILAWDDSTLVSPGKLLDRGEDQPRWAQAGTDEQITGIALGKNAVVFGGGHYPKEGGSGGFVRAVDRATGQPIAEQRFPAPLAYQGLAIADGKIYATFEDGTLVCIGAE
jgi:outer membrane protein assembly factor BamB